MSSEEPLESDETVRSNTSEQEETDNTGGTDDPADADTLTLSDREQLEGELARLESENERLREEYARSQQARYRRTALALGAVGVLAALGGLLAASARTTLFALAGTGLFLGILTYYLSPEQFLPASVGRDIYTTLAGNEEQVVAELGLSDKRIYVDVDGPDGVRLYVPQSEQAPLPDSEAFGETFVVDGGARGVSFEPSGSALFGEFERALGDAPETTPSDLAPQLTDALVEQFELVESAEQSVSGTADEGELTVGVVDSTYGPLDQFDHPLVSFLAVGLAQTLETTVAVTVEADGNDRVDAVVTCRWPYDPQP